MARHSSGKTNYSLSGNAIAVIVVVIVLIAGLVWWFGFRDNSAPADDQAAAEECIEGELTMPVAAADDALAETALSEWEATDPVVRDYCVQPELVGDISQAAVYIGPDSPATTDAIEQAGRTTSTSEPSAVASAQVGLAGADAAAEDIDAAAVAYPVAEQPEASIIAADHLAEDEAAAAELIQRDSSLTVADTDADYVATTQSAAADDQTFTPLGDAAVVYSAFPLAAGENTDEEQTRAASAFAEQASESYAGETSSPALSNTDYWAAADAQGAPPAAEAEETTEAPAPSAAPADTLFLIDTSRYMEPYIGEVNASVAGLAQGLTDADQQVALWNYSSPLNPGVTQGWRRNLAFLENGAEVGTVLERLGTGGVPQTRSAVTAAVSTAADQSALTGNPTRVLLVTTGTEADMGDAAFEQSLNQAMSEDVHLSVIHVGDREVDQVLADAADAHTPVAGGELGAALNEAAGLN